MNLGIQQTSRHQKSHRWNAREIPPLEHLSKFVSKFGLDLSDIGDEAEQIWANLNDLHDSDPEGYQSFIQKQFNKKNASNYFCSQDSAGKTIQPQKGFVVQASFATNQNFLFVNFCHHEAMISPLDQNQNQNHSLLQKRDFYNLQIPLAVSSMRKINDKSVAIEKNVVDLIFNPWCIQKAKTDSTFQFYLINLGLNSIKEECRLNDLYVEKNWRMIENLEYINDHGKHNDDVSPFIIKSEPNREIHHSHKMNDMMPNIPQSYSSSSFTIESKDNNGSGCRKIEEITSNNLKRTSKPLSKTMKGFLLKRRINNSLYDDKGSSGDGLSGTGGSYVKFLSKCNVVNLAEKENVAVKTNHKNQQNKHFGAVSKKSGSSILDSNMASIHGEKSMSESVVETGEGIFDTEFQRLIEYENPELEKQNTSERKKLEKENDEFLSKLSNLLQEDQDDCGPNLHDTKSAVKLNDKQLPNLQKNKDITVGGNNAGKQDLPSLMKKTKNNIIIEVDLSTYTTAINLLSSIDLQVSENCVKLTATNGKSVTYDFDDTIDVNKVCAKSSIRNKKIKIKCPIQRRLHS